jgi:hypothetical protein
MKKIFNKTLLLAVFFALGINVSNAQNSSISLARTGVVKQVDNTIEFTINASEPFYVGGNMHILTIDKERFSLYRQEDLDGKGKLIFLIPSISFSKLKEGASIYLSYGEVLDELSTDDEMQDVCKISPDRCKYLGSFSKSILSK